jgi:iron complex outermembrane recepter protein
MKQREENRHARLMSGVATGVALFMSMSGVAYAQSADSEEIVITGIRAAIEDAIEIKREETSIVEVVSAEDIGKLPDVSIAESIARLPGLTAQRLNGRGQVISVRGLGPDFTTALLNGREQVSVGDNRGVEFDQYPSELLSSVVVYKTPDAGLLGQGIGGTVDLRTVRPLDQDGRTLAFGARYEWNELGALNAGTEDSGYRFNAAYVDQFMDGRLGVAIGIATMLSPSQGERFNAWGYPIGPGGAALLGGSKSYVQSNELERTGIIGTIEFEPSNTFSATLDVYYSQFEETQTLRGIELPLAWSSATLAPGFTTANGFITQGTFNGVKGVIRNDVNFRDSEIMSVGVNAQWDVSDFWSLELDASFSGVDRTDQILETYSGTGPNGVGATDNLGFRSLGSAGFIFSPTLNYADYSQILLTSPQGWGTNPPSLPNGQTGYLNQPTIEDELTAVRLSATRSFESDWLSSVEVGVNVSDRSKSFVSDEWFLRLPGGAASAPIPTNLRLGSTSLAFLGLGNMVSYDPLALLGSGALERVSNPNGDVANKDWTVDETVTTGYIQFNLDSDWGATPLRGNFGVQIVNVEQEGSGLAVSSNGSGFQSRRVVDGAEFTEVLPSINLTFEVSEDSVFRVAAARTMMRPRMDDMRGGRTVNFNSSPTALANTDPRNTQGAWSANGGNPQLEPYLATGFDLSYERYIGDREGYFAAAVFHKNLETWIVDRTLLEDFTGFPFTSPSPPAIFIGPYYTKDTVNGGFIRGVELSLSLPLSIYHDALDGFGILTSYSYTDSEITPDAGQAPITVPGLSETVYNLTGYYERYGFQARVSYRYRSEFLGEVSGFANGRQLRFVNAESVVDAQIGYRFENGPLEGLSIILQGNNLTDEDFSTYNDGSASQVIDYQSYGQTYLLGVTWRR